MRIGGSHNTGDQGLPAQRGTRGPHTGHSGVSSFPKCPRGCSLCPDKSRESLRGWCCSGISTLALSALPCSDKFTRFCQWKNVELNIHVSRNPCPSPPRDGEVLPGSLRVPHLGKLGQGVVSRLTPVSSSPLQFTMNDFSVHRIIGRGGFGEVYGCRKADTGKM